MNLDVLYLDNHLLVISKPPGLLSQADRTGDPDVLTLGKAFLKEKFNKPGDVFLGLVHRLDRPVSGVMVLARTSKAARRLSRQFRQRLVEKRYLALVEGTCEGWGRSVDYLMKEDRQVRVVPADHPNAQRAELTWRALDRQEGLSLIEVELKTGRPHQIRVQLAHRGHPVLGDVRYGAERAWDGRNLALHAYRIGLEHPTQRKHQRWTVLPPSTWEPRFTPAVERLLEAGR